MMRARVHSVVSCDPIALLVGFFIKYMDQDCFMYRVIFGSVLLASLVGVSQAGVDGVLSVDLARWALLNSEDPTTYPDGVQSKSSGVQLTGGVVHHNLDVLFW